MSPSWYRYDPAGQRLTLTLHVQPGARENRVVGLHGDALKVRIRAPAAENRANAELVGFLSEWLGVPRTAVAIVRGASGRRKIVEIAAGAEVATRAASLG